MSTSSRSEARGRNGQDGGLSWPLRVELWDAALEAVRATLRQGGLREVSTPCRVEAVAIEPWIEPIPSGHGAGHGTGAKWLATSPELAMKTLLARGSGSIFQIAHVFRAAEVGAHHSEEFHLIEWYRTPGELLDVMADVEALVAAVHRSAAEVLARHGLEGQARRSETPLRWRRVKVLELMGETLGHELTGMEGPEALEPHLRRVRADLGAGLSGHGGHGEVDGASARLEAWTELFSLWSDAHLDPLLRALGPDEAVHVVDFPAPLAALSQVEGNIARRFESHVGAVELANGYRELADVDEQRRRFEAVAALRRRHGLPPLPMPEAFLAELDRLPPCSGVALGLDRLLALACGRDRLVDVSLAPQ
ncbi:MAG: hypothetical protein KC457_14555 [Myxococcales bacterium]|nr:hypothetical protein [Myxococcales bacterium]